jgi:type III secretion protein D
LLFRRLPVNEAAPYRFEVQSGLYAGLSGEMAAGSRLIGSGLDADLVFVEQELEPHHLRVSLSEDSIEIEALAPGVAVNGAGKIAAGDQFTLPLPVTIHAGAMSIRWSMLAEAEAAPTAYSRFSTPTLAVASLGLLALAVALSTIIYNASADASIAPAPAVAELAPKLAVSRPDDQSTRAAAQALQGEIEKAGLLNIRVGSGPGVVTAEGTIEPALVPEWQKLQQWFDHGSNGALTLVNGVVVKEEKPPSSIAVEAVWRGTQPYLLVRGQKYFVGAMLDDGWTIHRIEEGRVLLSRNGRFAAVPY